MMKGNDIEERLIDFAVRIISVCTNIPKSDAGKHISRQLVRSGTAPAAHYAEARGAESTKDFIHKLRICLKELNESRVWLKIMIRSQILSEQKLSHIIDECDQLCRIINASVRTASGQKS